MRFITKHAILTAAFCLLSPVASAFAQDPRPTPTNPPPAQPGAPAPSPAPPGSNAAPIRPANEAQQSTQPEPRVQQERRQTSPNTGAPRPATPQIRTETQQNPPGATPNTTTPAGTTPANPTANPNAAPVTSVPATPNQQVGAPGGIAPADLPTEPPPIAPDFRAPSRPLPSAERVGVDIANQLPLTLNEAIALALQNNNDIDGSRINVEIAELALRGARGAYDPLASNETLYERSTTPTSSTIGGAGASGSVTQTDLTSAFRVGGFTPFAGGSYQADFTSTRLTTNNQNVRLNPQFPSAFTLTYTQPLWRGLRFDVRRRNIEIAKKNISLSDAQFRQRAVEVISQVEAAYWDLAFALRNLQVQIDAVKQARTQVESNGRLVEKGALAPIEIVAATTQVTTFEQNVYTAQEAVTRAENILKTLLLADRSSDVWARPLTPVTPVDLAPPPRVDLTDAVAAALKNRPEIAQFATNAEINQIDTRYLRDLTKPQIDLVGNYTTAGLAGALVAPSTNTTQSTNSQLIARVNQLSAAANLPPLNVTTTTSTVAPNLVGGYPQSITNLIQNDYPTYQVGVRISLPLKNRAAEANLGQALANGRLIANNRAQAEQVIEADVRNAVQALRSAEARLQAAAAARASTEQQYESEQRQFRAGTTTVYLVLQRQTELLAARGRELQAQTDLNKAIAEFNRATGATLETNNVSINKDASGTKIEFRAPTVLGLNPLTDPLVFKSTNATAAPVKNDK
jgi:outer membrane protein TolC